ncbi:MAG: response regulator [Candidatus Dormibacteria bacterium]|jgi:putative two-component system response regulator/two-component system response regulator RpaA
MAGTRILLAEDEGIVARPLIVALRGRGHQVRWVRAVRELRAELPAFGPQLLILDLSLDTDGLEYLQAIRFTPDCPPAGVVVLADPGDTVSRDRAHQLGAAAVVSKPVEETRLVALVEELVSFL